MVSAHTNARTRKGPARAIAGRRKLRNKGIVLAKAATARVRKRERKNITSGVAHVNATFNNTLITITDAQGNAHGRQLVAWVSRAAGNYPYAARVAAENAAQKLKSMA